MKPFDYVQDARVVLANTEAQIKTCPRALTLSGLAASVMIAASSPSKIARPATIMERNGLRWHIRVWFRNDTSNVWFSTGYHRIGILRMAPLWLRALWYRHRRRRDFPRATVVP